MKTLLAQIFLGWALHSIAFGQIDTAPVGFNTVVCLADSDTRCSVPFVSKWEMQGLVSGMPSSASGHATITPQASENWTSNQFATFYFVRILSGTKAGMYYQITGNDASALTIDLAGDDISAVADGDAFAISRFWTLASLFPPASQITIVPSTSTAGSGRRTQVLIPDVTSAGVNLAPNRTFFLHNGQWKSTAGFAVADDFILPPDTHFIIRHSSSAITSPTRFFSMGAVELNPVSMPLATLTTGGQDNATVNGRPVPIKLKDLDLLSSGAFSGSTSIGGSAGDKLYFFDNFIPGINKAATKSYHYYTGSSFGGPGWRMLGGGSAIRDDDQPFQPGSGLMIRKAATATGETFIWTHSY